MKVNVLRAACLGLIFAVGCARESSTTSAPPNSAASADSSKYLMDEEPDGAEAVIKVREAAKDGDEVLIVGRIGGSADPWIKGRAAFTIVDGSLKACSDMPGDECETPWDYCCETDKLAASTALVKVVDENDELVPADARQLLNVKELSTVVVRGRAQRDDAGNLIVLARGVYVRN